MNIIKKKITTEELYLDEDCQFRVEISDAMHTKGERVAVIRGPWIGYVIARSRPKGKKSTTAMATFDRNLIKRAVKEVKKRFATHILKNEETLTQLQAQVVNQKRHLEEIADVLATIS